MPVVVSNPARQLQRRAPDRFPARFEEALARAEGDSDLAWIALDKSRKMKQYLESEVVG